MRGWESLRQVPISVWGMLLLTPSRPAMLGGGRGGWTDFPSLTSGLSWPETLICFEAQPQNSKCLTSLEDLDTLCSPEGKFLEILICFQLRILQLNNPGNAAIPHMRLPRPSLPGFPKTSMKICHQQPCEGAPWGLLPLHISQWEN